MRRLSGALIFALAVAAFVAFLTPKVWHLQNLQTRSDALEKEILRIKAQNKRLEQELYLLREDPVYIEKVARGKFNKAKQGEIVYKVVKPGEGTAQRT